MTPGSHVKLLVLKKTISDGVSRGMTKEMSVSGE